jgi:geranylgeranyl pyrophosphate synthase
MDDPERAIVERLMADPTPSDALIKEVIDVVRRNGGVDVARERAIALTTEAEAELELLAPGDARDALRDCLAYVVDRRS